MADNARNIHVSPGIYTREIELTYAVRSLGITTLGLVGETMRGPAFQPMDISNWREFQEMFGGTSTEKFRGSQYPKYELPYIAKSYLSESEQLKVVRVLGLGGYNAGPAWVITASKDGGNDDHDRQAVAVIRSRGHYSYYNTADTTTCQCEKTKFDALEYEVGEKTNQVEVVDGQSYEICSESGYNMNALQIKEYIPFESTGNECIGFGTQASPSSWAVSQTNRGRFKLVGVKGKHTKEEVNSILQSKECGSGYFEYALSLNPYDKDYILNVLGTKAYDGESPIYVESLYDVALEQGIASYDINYIDSGLTIYNAYKTADYCHHEPVDGIVDRPQNSLTRKRVGNRYLANKAAKDDGIRCVEYDYSTNQPMTYLDIWKGQNAEEKNASLLKPVVARYYERGVKIEEGTIIDEQVFSAETKWSDTEIKKPQLDSGYEHVSEWGGYTDEVAQVSESIMIPGQIYTVKQYTTQDGKRYYYYAFYSSGSVATATANRGEFETTNLYGNLLSGGTKGNTNIGATLVLNNADGLYYRMENKNTPEDIEWVELDMNDYKSAYRHAVTPWIVSNLKGDYNRIEVNKLFRFHTISDGDNSNYEVKVSIENIRPDEGAFDVIVRRIDDLDESIIPLEKFARCTMVPGDANYIAYRIGTPDGVYESKSKFITVEVNETTAARTSVPAGFLGYPIPKYSGRQIMVDPLSVSEYGSENSNVVGSGTTLIKFPTIKYNRDFDEDIKNRKQYFGLSSWVGVDIDNFTFKGTKAYINDVTFLSHGFHLDSRLDNYNRNGAYTITVDGECGYEFDSVSTNARTQVLDQPPVIGKETEMYGSIYEYVNLRKFTVFFYGGFDGWDVYRDQRSNTDNFKMTQYRGYINQQSGEGYSFNKIQNPDLLGLNQNGITSDWYAYLAAIRQFSNPEATDINVLATPGIDYVNQKLLVEETIEMVEEERADSIYVVTTPDKPSGAGDYVDEMYTPEDAVYNLEDTEIDSNYTCTYYPWVKYLDVDNNQYIYLPPTKDVVRNFAQTDNQSYPWFAPAGVERGNVDCVRAHIITKLADEDVLYDGRINPVKTFAQDGPKIWGQKNLQINESQLNRIAVRRLLLRMRKLIAISCIGLIFEPNDSTAKQSFISTVTPIMDSIRSNRGISDYRIEVNDTLESRERRELPAKIFFKPYNALEYITIDFILTPEGVSFSDI